MLRCAFRACFETAAVLIALVSLAASQEPAPAARVGALRVTVLSTMLADTVGVGEWGFAALVEADGRRFLFDTGARPATVLENARALGVDLAGVRDVVLSHHHADHTGGLLALRRALAARAPRALSVAHVAPGFFAPRRRGPGAPVDDAMERLRSAYERAGGRFVEHAAPARLAPGVWLSGRIPRPHSERNWSGAGQLLIAGRWQADAIPEDLALFARTAAGLVVVSGCGHAGIVNTLEHARVVLGERAPIHAAVGGFHLFAASERTLDWTAQRLRALELQQLLGAHCTGIEAVWQLRRGLGLARSQAVVGAVGSAFVLGEGLRPGTIAR